MRKYYNGVKEKRNILQTMKSGKANLIGHILRRNCLLKHIIEGKRVRMRRRGRRLKRLWTCRKTDYVIVVTMIRMMMMMMMMMMILEGSKNILVCG